MTGITEGKITEIYVGSYEDIILARQKIRVITQDLSFSLLDQLSGCMPSRPRA